MKDERKEKRLDEILKRALTSEIEPDPELNWRIIQQWKECFDMKKQIAKRIYVAAAACAAMLVTVSAGAAVRYLTLDEVIDETKTDNNVLAAAFSGENAMKINESQEAGGYRATLLGIAPGKNLTDQGVEGLEGLSVGSMYVVVAIENADGTPLPETSEYSSDMPDFFVSPLIQGLEPWWYNAITFGGSYTQFTNQGVFYRLLDCDNILMFADHDLYLCVTDNTFYDKVAYNYDEVTGEISRNEDYVGMNVLFEIPVDPSMADPEAAAAYLAQMDDLGTNGETGDEGILNDTRDIAALAAEITDQIWAGNEDVLAGAVALESQTRIVTKENGRYEYEFDAIEDIREMPKESVEEVTSARSTWFFYEDNIIDGKYVAISYGDYDENLDQFNSLYIMILTENGDGTAEVRSYYMALPAKDDNRYGRDQLARDIESQILAGDEEKVLEGSMLVDGATRTVSFENGQYSYEVRFTKTHHPKLYFHPEYMKDGKGVITFMGDEDDALYIAVLTENGDDTAEVKVYAMNLSGNL